MENENGRKVRKGGEFLTKGTNPIGDGYTLEGILRLFLEDPRR